MCLVVSVELFVVPKKDAQLLISQQRSSDAIDLRFEGMTEIFNRGNPRLSLSEKGEGCACSMLTDDADWNATTWDMREEIVAALADTIITIHRQAGNGFAFEALWIGDRPKTEQRVTIDDLAGRVRCNQVGTKVRYVVAPAPNER